MCDASPSSSRCESSDSQASEDGQRLRVGVVGICGAGKTTLALALRTRGYEARQISQEHSYVHDLWRRFWTPDVLVYLDASDETIDRRLGASSFPRLLASQRQRLRHAREHSLIYVRTDALSEEEVLAEVLAALSSPAAVLPVGSRATPPPPAG